MTHRLARRLLWGALILIVLAAAYLWLFPSRDYLYVPNAALPVAGKVKVPGEKSGDDKGALYYVDVSVRRASWAEKLVPFVRPDGASLVPKARIVPPGSTFDARVADGLREMKRSEAVAAAVALKAAGYDVRATPRGALIESVDPDAPAAATIEEGDVIVRARGRAVRTPTHLRQALADLTPGTSVALRVRRDGKTRSLSVPTVASRDDPKRAIIGILVAQDADIKLPLDVRIDLGQVGGPSAGLPFALDVLQELGRDVDRGRRVVATGEIALDGSVGPIGGVKQKVFGAREAGADVFLVPAGDNATEARRYAGNLRIIPVVSFQQALSALRTLPPI